MIILLDDVDITDDIQAQAQIPNLSGGVYPNASTKWYNLIPIVENHPELKDTFFSTGGLHTLKIQDDPGYQYDVKIILRLCYSARNS